MLQVSPTRSTSQVVDQNPVKLFFPVLNRFAI